MIGTRILKIDLEIVEIIEVKVGNHHLEIDILLLGAVHILRKHFYRLKQSRIEYILILYKSIKLFT